jgi:SsrA-binding protein
MKTKKDNNLYFKNKRVYFDYDVLDKIEAGIQLTGTEVKSLRDSKVSLIGSFCIFKEDGLYVKGTDIATYDDGTYNNHDPKRDRKILLHKKELEKLKVKLEEKGLSIVPLSIYTNQNNMFKMEIGVCKGRKAVDKREYIKERETKRELKEVSYK